MGKEFHALETVSYDHYWRSTICLGNEEQNKNWAATCFSVFFGDLIIQRDIFAQHLCHQRKCRM